MTAGHGCRDPAPSHPAKAKVNSPRRLLHEPTMAHDDGLPGQGITWEGGEKNGRLRNILKSGEFAVDSLSQHDVFDDRFFGNTELLSLLRDLLID